jgi:hypothetical protein
MAASAQTAGIDLYWLPLGAGGHSVRLNARIFEAVAALLDRRERRDLYHSALQVYFPEARYLGNLYYPAYFTNGYAVHGSNTVPA